MQISANHRPAKCDISNCVCMDYGQDSQIDQYCQELSGGIMVWQTDHKIIIIRLPWHHSRGYGLTACTPGSARGPTFGIEYGKAFTFTFFAIAPDKEYGRYAAIRKVKKDFGGTRSEIVFITCLLARSRRRHWAGHNNPKWHFLLHKKYCTVYWILHKHSGCIVYV